MRRAEIRHTNNQPSHSQSLPNQVDSAEQLLAATTGHLAGTDRGLPPDRPGRLPSGY